MRFVAKACLWFSGGGFAYMNVHALRLGHIWCLIISAVVFLHAQAPKTNDTEPFERLVARAQTAMESDRIPEAIRLYARATLLRPSWSEGWWHLGTLLFDSGRFREARGAFAHFVSVERAQPGPGFAMLGLSEFRLKEYLKALPDLERGTKLGLG